MDMDKDIDMIDQLMLVKCNIFSGVEGKKRSIFYKQVSDYMRNINEQMALLVEKERHSCHAGCDVCCNQIFAVYRAEVEMIACYLLENEDLLKKFIANASAREPRIQPHRDLIQKTTETEDASYEYFKQKIPCAFLDAGACLIYPVRPVVCSAHISSNSPRICSLDPKGFITAKMKELRRSTWIWMKARSRDQCKQDKEVVDVSHLVFEHLKHLCAVHLAAGER